MLAGRFSRVSRTEAARHRPRTASVWPGTEGRSVGGSVIGSESNAALHKLDRLQAGRDHLTYVLRGLAADLDELDRRLSDNAWRCRCQPDADELHGERTALEALRRQLTVRLRGLARQLSEMDNALSNLRGQ